MHAVIVSHVAPPSSTVLSSPTSFSFGTGRGKFIIISYEERGAEARSDALRGAWGLRALPSAAPAPCSIRCKSGLRL